VRRAGELFVAAELNRRGAIASLYLTNTPRVDVVASNIEQTRIVNIQVKTKGPGSTVWQGNISKIEPEAQRAADSDFIVFVDLQSMERAPDYYVCKLREFAQQHFEQHQRWLKSKGGVRPGGGDSTHTSIRLPEVKNGKDRWDLLDIFEETIPN